MRGIRRGFTMVEIVIALLLLTIGALGYAVVTVGLARALYMDARRSRSGSIIESQRETLLRQGCANATNGSAVRFGMPVEWTASAGLTRPINIRVTRAAPSGMHTDSLSGIVPCL